ncbi:Na+/H+ antiporter subunit E [Enemella sp. A6]|uniref:Na+/H+ antiporter subunit E n=1 Tax=Enemella sp. A6 TaxID=3440152 RepID=UPI003EB827F2
MSPDRVRQSRLSWLNAGVALLVWMLLWGTFNIPLAILGLVVAVLVAVTFPMTPINFRGTFRPHWWFLMFLRFLWDLVVASIAVLMLVFRPRMDFKNAVIRVPMRVQSDLIQTQTAELVCLVPGSIVLEATRATPVLYVHNLDVPNDPEALDEVRERVRDAEARVLHFLGSKEHYQKVRAERRGEEVTW